MIIECGEWFEEEYDLECPYILGEEWQVRHVDEEWRLEREGGDEEGGRASGNEEDDVWFLRLREVLGRAREEKIVMMMMIVIVVMIVVIPAK